MRKITFSKINSIIILVVTSTLVLFFFSSIRHALFQSGALDLGFFDQGIYLISQGLYPRSTIIDIHMLGDHAALILYPLSLFYKIYPDIHWLFLIQAIAISISIFPIVNLSQKWSLSNKNLNLILAIYLLSPILFNANSTYDFHPDIFALPCLLWAIVWSQENKLGLFSLSIIGLLISKAVFSLIAIALGIWLIFCNQRKKIGLVTIFLGIFWFLIATQVIMPTFGASTERFALRYSYLGESYSSILGNLFWKPNLILSKLFSVDSLVYLLLLFAPYIWCIRYKNLNYLIIVLPTIIMNILSNDPQQRYLSNHYPLPVLPVLILMVISEINDFTDQKKWRYRFIVFWTVLAFVAMSRLNLFAGEYLQSLDTWQANQEAIALVKNTKGSILTTHEIAPHVTHRSQVRLAFSNSSYQLADFDYILLNTRHSGYQSDREYTLSLVEQAKQISSFKLEYQKDDVYLFAKKNL
ncbi:DUF2079 domain-containing protein [Pseudanabaena sp. FACHB-1998]|uniref:DUF2079 domain-containing protein n=1 Tax=Pseudanabaena sp. FACHB-1998 TaxID=2692858 RepID=UPI0016805A4D|nr:DUF2079 domain-containing protein [Pseudanabaena sp. FACHB-1998]MBD2179138.1 DUF2079 domain-containing protein [Pseudanabaena sp. FACHB-1998]